MGNCGCSDSENRHPEKSFSQVHSVPEISEWEKAEKVDSTCSQKSKSINPLKSLETQETEALPSHLEKTARYLNAADSLIKVKEFGSALGCLQKAVDVLIPEIGEISSDVGLVYRRIGNIYDKTREYEKAREFYLKSCKVWKSLGDHSDELAVVYFYLGRVSQRIGEDQKAVEWYVDALLIYQTEFESEETGEIGRLYNNLGKMYCRLGQYEEAIKYHLKAKEMRIRIYGKEHMKVAGSYKGLGVVYSEKKEYGKAREYLKVAYEIAKALKGDTSPEAVGMKERLELLNRA